MRIELSLAARCQNDLGPGGVQDLGEVKAQAG